jgi:hypothetical protein
MGDRRDLGPHDNYPGPTHYSPDDALAHEKAPKWPISPNPNGGHVGPIVNPNSAGPGQYNLPSYLGEGP